MSNKSLSTVAICFICFGPRLGIAEPGLLRTVQALDDSRGYCIDIAGFGQNARLDDPLQVHTCKYGGTIGDQLFERVPEEGRLRTAEYERCLAAAAHEPGAELLVRPCADSPLQRWSFAWGHLSPESRPDLCVSLADEAGEVAGTPAGVTPVYRHQEVRLELCEEAAEARQALSWSSPQERSFSTADVVRSKMPEEIAAELAGIGRRFNGDIVRRTAQMYASVPRVHESAEIDVARDIPYGAHELQRLDIHTGAVRRSDRGRPSVVVFHGGGLVGGNRSTTSSASDYFASLGMIGVSASYRLAPDHPWPEGARDVGAAVTWLRENVAAYGGDPERVFVMGLSSGALHAATYVYRPELMPVGTARPAGAILMSGPYTFDFDNPTGGEVAYFGEDPSLYPERVVVGNVTPTDLPVLFTTAEWDIARYTGAFSALLDEIMTKQGVMPRYKQSLGHNHTSQLLAIGTADTGVSSELVDFIFRTVGD